MFSIEITGNMHSSRLTPRNSMIVSGTKMISDTSLVTNMELKNTPKIRKSESPAMDLKLAASLISGLKSFSCLKPSSTVSIIKRVPSVCQSIFWIRSGVGGVMNSDMRAAASDTSSIGSFFITAFIFSTRGNSITGIMIVQEVI